jgi:hypothetical protein
LFNCRIQANALIEPDRGRFSNSGRFVAYPDGTAFFWGLLPDRRLFSNNAQLWRKRSRFDLSVQHFKIVLNL